MKESHRRPTLASSLIIVSALFLLWGPTYLQAQPGYRADPSASPVEVQIVREGDFAVALAYGLGLADGRDEAEAEDKLSSLGIMPTDGWVSDDPVTPDMVGDLEAATVRAADANRLSLTRDEALRRFVQVVEESGMGIRPAEGVAGSASNGSTIYTDQYDMDHYYDSSEGPPVITYYEPPPAYYYLYSWVPYPFWYGGRGFTGYYILKDYHRHSHNRRHVSNTGQYRSNQGYRGNEGYRTNEGRKSHVSSGLTNSDRWSQEVPASMIRRSASPTESNNPVSRRPIVSAVPRQPARSDRTVRGELSNASAARPIGNNITRRFSSPRTAPPSSLPASTGIRQGIHSGESLNQPAAGGWSKGMSGARGFTGIGNGGFRR